MEPESIPPGAHQTLEYRIPQSRASSESWHKIRSSSTAWNDGSLANPRPGFEQRGHRVEIDHEQASGTLNFMLERIDPNICTQLRATREDVLMLLLSYIARLTPSGITLSLGSPCSCHLHSEAQ